MQPTLFTNFEVLSRAVLPADTIGQARFLLGSFVVRPTPEGVTAGRIVETEAYPPGDPAAHHYRRMTARNRSLFREHGHAYVYRAYGTCWMLNVSSETDGIGAGVLIRAVEPALGIALMAARRGTGVAVRDVARGPGRLAAAFAIDRGLDGVDLCAPGPLFLAHPPGDIAGALPEAAIGASVRIGITRAMEEPWRFFVRGSRLLSGPAWLNGAGRRIAPCPPAARAPM